MIIIEKFGTINEANHKIRGGIVGGSGTERPYEGLVGKTITFSTPSGTKTFTQPTGTQPGQMLFSHVKAQLEAAIATIEVLTVDGKIAFRHKTAGQVVALAALDEPARAIFGLANNQAISGQFLNGPGGAAPKYIDMVTENGAVYIATEV